MLNGTVVKVGEIVRFTMFTNWTFKQNSEHKITAVSKMDKNGWFDIKVEGDRDWHCCLHFSQLTNEIAEIPGFEGTREALNNLTIRPLT